MSILRRLKPEDSKVLAKLINNRKILDNLRDIIPFPYGDEDANKFISTCMAEERELTFAITYNANLVGVIGLIGQTDVYRLSAELGYWVGEQYWGKGLATEAVQEMVRYGFKELDLVRIFSSVFEFNRASMRVLEKAGFSLEGISRKAVIKNGKIVDEYRYAILNRDKE